MLQRGHHGRQRRPARGRGRQRDRVRVLKPRPRPRPQARRGRRIGRRGGLVGALAAAAGVPRCQSPAVVGGAGRERMPGDLARGRVRMLAQPPGRAALQRGPRRVGLGRGGERRARAACAAWGRDAVGALFAGSRCSAQGLVARQHHKQARHGFPCC